MTAQRISYEYIVLRYMHDITSGEFINIGVLASSKDSSQLCFRFRTTYTRLKGAFPSLDGEAFRARIRALRAFYKSVADKDVEVELALELNKRKLTTVEFAHLAIPPDDSALQWGPVGAGLTRDLNKTTEQLFERFVSAHDSEHVAERKKDEDVWKIFSTELERRNLSGVLVEKTIEVADDSIKFQHAWKNGKWHCFEPLSFDLASEESIKAKAHRWLGRLASVKTANEDFNVYFLVGKPEDSRSTDAYRGAIKILRKFENAFVVEEHETEQFGNRMAEQMLQRAAPPFGH